MLRGKAIQMTSDQQITMIFCIFFKVQTTQMFLQLHYEKKNTFVQIYFYKVVSTI